MKAESTRGVWESCWVQNYPRGSQESNKYQQAPNFSLDHPLFLLITKATVELFVLFKLEFSFYVSRHPQ